MALPELYKYQKEDLSKWWNKLKGRGILGWQVGLGKTFSGARIVKYYVEKGESVLIVAPTSLIYDWIENVAEHNVELTKFQIKTRQKNKKKYKVVEGYTDCMITTYDMLKKVDLRYFDIVIGDEIHYIKGLTTERSKAFVKFAKQSKHFLGMSGTLSQQRDQIELLAYLYAINNTEDELPKNKTHYLKYWCEMNKKYMGDRTYMEFVTKKDKAMLMNNLIKKYTSFRKASDVIDLPEYVDKVIRVDSAIDLKQYLEELQKQFDVNISDSYQKPHIIHALKMANGIDYDTGEFINKVKFEAILELLNSMPKDEQVIIWTQWRDFGKQLKEYLKKDKIDCELIIGDTPQKERQQHINNFKSGNLRVIIASQGTISEGQNLQNCRYSIFANVWYDSTKFEQCKGRTYRNGQKRTTFNYTIVGKGSLEEEALAVLNQKLSLRDAEDYFNTILNRKMKEIQ